MPLPRIRSGERHPNHKLTKAQIAAARELIEREDLTYPEAVRRLNLPCSWWTLRRAVRGETYKDEG
jgi:hypothetical protein